MEWLVSSLAILLKEIKIVLGKSVFCIKYASMSSLFDLLFA